MYSISLSSIANEDSLVYINDEYANSEDVFLIPSLLPIKVFSQAPMCMKGLC